MLRLLKQHFEGEMAPIGRSSCFFPTQLTLALQSLVWHQTGCFLHRSGPCFLLAVSSLFRVYPNVEVKGNLIEGATRGQGVAENLLANRGRKRSEPILFASCSCWLAGTDQRVISVGRAMGARTIFAKWNVKELLIIPVGEPRKDLRGRGP